MPHETTELYSLLFRQFAECLQAVTSLTESLKELHEEVRDQSNTLTEIRTKIPFIEEKAQDLQHIIRGEGGQSLLRTAAILERRIETLEDWLKTFREETKTRRQEKLSKTTLVITVLTSTLTAFIVWLLQHFLKKGS